jgi:hypothetical protein
MSCRRARIFNKQAEATSRGRTCVLPQRIALLKVCYIECVIGQSIQIATFINMLKDIERLSKEVYYALYLTLYIHICSPIDDRV